MAAISIRRPATEAAGALATETGAVYTVAEVANPVLGIEGGDTPPTMTLPTFEVASQPVYAWRLDGDAMPRVVLCTNPWYGLYLGNGTDDPVNDTDDAQACNVYFYAGQGLSVDVYDEGRITLRAPDGVRIPAGPLDLASPDEDLHPLTVSNAGVLSVDGVPVGGSGASYVSTFKWGVD